MCLLLVAGKLVVSVGCVLCYDTCDLISAVWEADRQARGEVSIYYHVLCLETQSVCFKLRLALLPISDQSDPGSTGEGMLTYEW